MDFMDTFSEENPKNYQIWHHRRAVVELFKDSTREKSFCEKVFEVDAKNYHAWAHRLALLYCFSFFFFSLLFFVDLCRQWAVKAYDLWAGIVNDRQDDERP